MLSLYRKQQLAVLFVLLALTALIVVSLIISTTMHFNILHFLLSFGPYASFPHP